MHRFLFIAALIAPALVQAQTVTGRVADRSTGEALVGANVTLQGTATGAATDAVGQFTLADVSAGVRTVRVSFVGYGAESRTVRVASGAPLDLGTITLAPQSLPGAEVTVTDTRARADAPVALANLTPADLRAQNPTADLPTILASLPSVYSYTDNGLDFGYTYLNVRGFDQRRVAVLVNGVPQNDPEDGGVFWIDFPDLAANLESAQVRRGAGTTSNAIGGVVDLTTSPLAVGRGVEIGGGTGAYGTRKFSLGATSGPVADRYAFSGRFSTLKTAGYIEQAGVDLSSYFLSAARFDARSVTMLTVYGGTIDDHLAYNGLPRAVIQGNLAAVAADDAISYHLPLMTGDPEHDRRINTLSQPTEVERFTQPHYEAANEWSLSPSVKLLNTLFYIRGKGAFDLFYPSFFGYDLAGYYGLAPIRTADPTRTGVAYEADSTGAPIIGPDGRYTITGVDALTRAYVDNKQLGWLPRLVWTPTWGELSLSGELRRQRSEHYGSILSAAILPEGVTPGDTKFYSFNGGKWMRSLAVRAAAKLTERVRAEAELQGQWQTYELDHDSRRGVELNRDYRFLNPRVGLTATLRSDLTGFVSLGRTSREPRLADLYDAADPTAAPAFRDAALTDPYVKPESVLDGELGLGFRRPDVRLDLTLYDMTFHDEIVKQGGVDRFGQPVVGNAERTRHRGVELAGAVGVTRLGVVAIGLDGTGSVSRNRIVRAVQFNGDGSTVDLAGRPVAGFPETLARLGVTATGKGATARVAVQTVGRQALDNTGRDDLSIAPFATVEASLSYRLPVRALPTGAGLELRLDGSNLLDRRYEGGGYVYGDVAYLYPAAPRRLFASIRLSL